nr:DUF4081 domain-containing GNAT family N-acetyltransferase [Nakamurella aerolata]
MTALSARTLGPANREQIVAALQADPIANCLVAERWEQAESGRALGGTFWGVGGGRDALVFAGGNLIPVSGTPAGLRPIATTLGRRRRTVASLVGSAPLVLPLWQYLQPHWGVAREVRPDQPLLACAEPPLLPPDPRIRAVPADFIDSYLPAAVAMFTEEVGADPLAGDDGRSYRGRVSELLQQGRAFALLTDPDAGGRQRVLFKAEIGALSRDTAMIQGVWVDPAWRGRGIAAPALAAVVQQVQQRFRRLPCLYVNQYNVIARSVYRRIGFQQVGTYATVLF